MFLKGDSKDMALMLRVGIYTIVAFALFAGCAYQRKLDLPSVGLPEEVFSTPKHSESCPVRVGVFRFIAPPYVQTKARAATRYFCREIEKNVPFFNVISHPDVRDMTLRNLVNIARINRYDLIITGKLLYYFDGSYLEPSKVTQEIRVIRIRGGKPRTLWHALATETIAPVLSNDLAVVQGRGVPAPSATVLMRRNAEKFCNMILNLPPLDRSRCD